MPNWIQVIDSYGNFNKDLNTQIKRWNTQPECRIVTSIGLHARRYKVLDQIFGTDFDQGWVIGGGVRLCPAKGANIIVMDIEIFSDHAKEAAIMSCSLSDLVIWDLHSVNAELAMQIVLKPFLNFLHVNGVREAGRILLIFYNASDGNHRYTTKEVAEAINRAHREDYSWSDFFEVAVVKTGMARLSQRLLDEKNNKYFFNSTRNKVIAVEGLGPYLEILRDRVPTHGEIQALLRREIRRPVSESDGLPKDVYKVSTKQSENIPTEKGPRLPTDGDIQASPPPAIMESISGSDEPRKDLYEVATEQPEKEYVDVEVSAEQPEKEYVEVEYNLYEVSTEQPEKEYVEMGIQVEYNGKNLPPDLDHSFFSLLLKLRSKKPGHSISEVANVLTIDLFRKLLGMDNYINMASLVGDSDTELLFEFVLYLLEQNFLRNMDLLDANRRARRLMFKIATTRPVIPKFMFITDVEMGRSVGWGGFADVYRGRFCGEPIAAKRLHTNRHIGSPESLTWKSLSHKFVLPFLGIYDDESHLFLVSPLMANGNLAAWRKESDRPVAEILKANVLLDSDCHVKIADFGLTRHFDATLTQSSSFSHNFAAPELFGTWDDDFSDSEEDSEGIQKTHKTDVYAFGSFYYEIHFNAIPFGHLEYVQLVKQVVRRRKRPDRLWKPPLSDQAWKLIRRCWRHDASRRPSMEEVLESMVAWRA